MPRPFAFLLNSCCRLPAMLAVTLMLASPVPAAVYSAIHDPHRLPANDEFQKTIEARCTICHTRERVDTAMREGEELEDLLQRMIERGAILSEKDKGVLGTFWGSPLKQNK